MLVDSHCHLDFPDFAPEFDAVIERARSAGVGTLVTIGTRLSRSADITALTERSPRLWCTLGLHPEYAGIADERALLAELVNLARHPKVIGLGETGLDYFYDDSPRDQQRDCFRQHLRACRVTGLPVIVHTRDADDDTAAILREDGEGVSGVIHCFSSSRCLAEEALSLGFYLSLSGIVTFKKAESLREIVRDVPIDRLLVETDAPYLAPVPHRGKRNEPAFVTKTAACVAAIKDMTTEAFAAATTANFHRLFAKAK